jgi:hypothetical protein
MAELFPRPKMSRRFGPQLATEGEDSNSPPRCRQPCVQFEPFQALHSIAEESSKVKTWSRFAAQLATLTPWVEDWGENGIHPAEGDQCVPSQAL